MTPMFPFAMLSVAIGVGLIVTAVFLHARALSRRLPPPPRRPWWEGRRPADRLPAEDEADPEPRPSRWPAHPSQLTGRGDRGAAAVGGECPRADAARHSEPRPHRRVFNPGPLSATGPGRPS